MKTKFYLLVGVTTVALTLSLGVARAQKAGYGGQKSTSSSTSATQSNSSTNDTQGLKPGSSLGGGKFVAIIVTPEEAAKKYPPPAGKSYPNGMDEGVLTGAGSATHSGYIKSPFSSRVYDCRKIGQGTLLLDDSAKKVFVRPPTK